MTDDMKDFELENLWQSEKGEIDMDMILDTRDKLERGRKLGRQLMNGALLLHVAMTFIFGFLGFAGLYKLGVWIAGAFFIFACMTWASTIKNFGRKRLDIADLSPIDTLKNAIKAANYNLSFARALYLLPISQVIGFIVGNIVSTDPTGPDIASAIPPATSLGWIGLGFMVSVGIAIFGLHLAKQKNAELQDLKARLKLFEGEV